MRPRNVGVTLATGVLLLGLGGTAAAEQDTPATGGDTIGITLDVSPAAAPPVPPGWKVTYRDSHCYAAIPAGSGANWAIGSCNPPAGATPWRVVGYCSTVSWNPLRKGKVYSAWQTGRVDTWTANCNTLNGGRQKIRDAEIDRW